MHESSVQQLLLADYEGTFSTWSTTALNVSRTVKVSLVRALVMTSQHTARTFDVKRCRLSQEYFSFYRAQI